MANPLFERLSGRDGTNPYLNQKDAQNAQNAPQADMQSMMAQLRSNPAQMIRQAGYNVPDEMANNPQAAVTHLIQTGQVGGPMMQRVGQMIGMLTGRR